MIECKNCNLEFDPESAPHKELGFYNQCFDCAEEQGIRDNKVKAFINLTEEGDFGGITVVSKDRFERAKRTEELYAE